LPNSWRGILDLREAGRVTPREAINAIILIAGRLSRKKEESDRLMSWKVAKDSNIDYLAEVETSA